jgi:hypothetical protein
MDKPALCKFFISCQIAEKKQQEERVLVEGQVRSTGRKTALGTGGHWTNGNNRHRRVVRMTRTNGRWIRRSQ